MKRILYGLGCFVFGSMLTTAMLLNHLDQFGIYGTLFFAAAFIWIVYFSMDAEVKK